MLKKAADDEGETRGADRCGAIFRHEIIAARELAECKSASSHRLQSRLLIV